MAKHRILILSSVLILGIMRFWSAFSHLRVFIGTLEYIISHPQATYEQKMDIKYPQYYHFINEVNSIVPESSSIIIYSCSQPISEQLLTNLYNYPLTQVLLYPREVSTSSLKVPETSLPSHYYFIACQSLPPPVTARQLLSVGGVSLWH